MKKQKTNYAKKESRNPNWLLINAEDVVLGRLASEIAKQLMGKNSVNYTPSVDTGDFVIVYNAEKIRLTGNKEKQKVYYRHSGYPGGLKTIDYQVMQAKKPEEIIRIAVKGMLPKNRLGRKLFTNLHVFVGENHNKEAQKPKKVELN